MSDASYVQLQSVKTTIAAGDAYLNSLKFENAVTAYQSAGTQSQSILAAGADPQADALDQQLQALSSNLASQATAKQAQSLANQIVAIYTPIVNAIPQTPGQASAGVVVAPNAPNATPTTSSPNWPAIALWGVVAVGVGGLFWLLARGPQENPVRVSAGPRRIGGKRALINKGRACHFVMKSGPDHHAGGSMLHDPSGRWWPRNSVLCGPFKRKATRSDVETTSEARHYLGRQANTYVIDTPTRSLGAWQYLGEVEEIRYTRTGRKKPGRYYHFFNKPGALTTLIKGKGKARLYRLGRYYRIDLPRDAQLDSRGFVFP